MLGMFRPQLIRWLSLIFHVPLVAKEVGMAGGYGGARLLGAPLPLLLGWRRAPAVHLTSSPQDA